MNIGGLFCRCAVFVAARVDKALAITPLSIVAIWAGVIAMQSAQRGSVVGWVSAMAFVLLGVMGWLLQSLPRRPIPWAMRHRRAVYLVLKGWWGLIFLSALVYLGTWSGVWHTAGVAVFVGVWAWLRAWRVRSEARALTG